MKIYSNGEIGDFCDLDDVIEHSLKEYISHGKNHKEKLEKIIPTIEPDYFEYLKSNYVTRDQLLNSGFNLWEKREGNKPDLFLLPNDFFYSMKNGCRFTDINYNEVIFNRNKTSEDNRGGFLAYGILKEK